MTYVDLYTVETDGTTYKGIVILANRAGELVEDTLTYDRRDQIVHLEANEPSDVSDLDTLREDIHEILSLRRQTRVATEDVMVAGQRNLTFITLLRKALS